MNIGGNIMLDKIKGLLSSPRRGINVFITWHCIAGCGKLFPDV